MTLTKKQRHVLSEYSCGVRVPIFYGSNGIVKTLIVLTEKGMMEESRQYTIGGIVYRIFIPTPAGRAVLEAENA